LEFLAEIREAALPIAVVIVTASGDEDAAVSALKTGADDYIVKHADYLSRLPITLVNAHHQSLAKSKSISRPFRVLYGEHNPVDIDLTRRHLKRKAPYLHLRTVNSGTKVLDILKSEDQKKFDLVLLDYRLPGETGLDILKEMRVHNINIPVVIVTGHGDEEIALQAIRMGAADYLIKNPGYLHQLTYVIETAIKNAEREKEQAELKESQARLLALFNNTQDAILLLNDHSEIVDANPAARSMVGYSLAELQYTKASALLPDYLTEKAKENWNTLLKKGILESEFQLLNKDGSLIYVNFRAVANIISGIHLTVIRDITNRKQAEEKIRKLSLAVEQSPVAILITNTNGDIEYSNPYFTELSGFSPEEVIGASVYKLLNLDEPYEYYLVDKILNASEIEISFTNKDGRQFWLTIVMSPIFDEANTISNYVVICQNITERVQSLIQIKKESDRSQSLARIAARLNQNLELANTLNIICEEIKFAACLDEVFVYTWNSTQEKFNYLEFFPHETNVAEQVFNSLNRMKWDNHNPLLPFHLTKLENWVPELSESECGNEIMILKMVRGEQLVSVLVAFSEKPFDQQIIDLIMDLSIEGVQAILNAQLLENVQKRLKQVQSLNRIETTIASSTDSKLVLNTIIEEAFSLLDIDAIDIYLVEETNLTLNLVESRGFGKPPDRTIKLRSDNNLASQVAINRDSLVIPEIQRYDLLIEQEKFYRQEGMTSYMAVPIIAKGKVKGVIEGFNKDKTTPDQEKLDLLNSLAKQAALSLDNASLFENLERSNYQLLMAYDTTIEGWSRALDLRDKETEGHTQRVTSLTLQLAKMIGISDNEIIHIRRGALLHDIGKMGVPDQILLKPDKLTPEEWEIMRRHPTYAYDLLLPIQFLRPALDIPYCHHEKWDGSGYPRGLRGAEIPLAARIFAVVDVWDALSSERPYRPAWPEEKVLNHIEEQKGIHFDVDVVKAFISLIMNNREPI